MGTSNRDDLGFIWNLFCMVLDWFGAGFGLVLFRDASGKLPEASEKLPEASNRTLQMSSNFTKFV